MNSTTLRNAIYANPALSGKPDSFIEQQLALPNFSILDPCPVNNVLEWLGINSAITKIADCSTLPTSGLLRSCAYTLLNLLQSSSDTINFSRPSVSGLLGPFISNAIYTQVSVNSFLSTMYNPATSGEMLFGRGTTITNRDVAVALGRI